MLGASVFGINALASALFEVPTGVWSDRVGRRGTVILGSFARVLAFILYAIGLSYWWLVAGAILEGLSRAFYSGNNDALLHDTLADEGLEDEYDVYLGKTSSAEHLALGISGLIGSVIASFSFMYLMWFSVISQIMMLYVSYQFREPKSRTKQDTNIYVHTKEAVKLFINNKKLRLLSLASITRFAVGEMKYQFRAAFINLVWPLWSVGITNVVSNFGASASFYYSGRIIKKFGALQVLMAQTIWGKLISFIAYGITSIFSPILLMTSSFFHGAGSVAENKLMQYEFNDHQRATMSSLNSLGGNLVFFFMSLLLGGLADLWGPAKAMFIMTFIELPVIYLYWLLFKNDRKIKS
jgi:MFS family permease